MYPNFYFYHTAARKIKIVLLLTQKRKCDVIVLSDAEDFGTQPKKMKKKVYRFVQTKLDIGGSARDASSDSCSIWMT